MLKNEFKEMYKTLIILCKYDVCLIGKCLITEVIWKCVNISYNNTGSLKTKIE